MTTARDEIFEQHLSLRQTYAYMQGQAESIKDFYGISGFYSVTFMGCGVVHALCGSSELSLRMRGGMTASSMSAGDLIINMPRYLDMLNGSMILASSRSGREAELVYALETARREAGATIIACSTGEHTEVSQHADIQLELPWAKDEGPYLTRSISSLYLVNLYNLGLLAGDVALVDEIKTATDGMEAFITSNTPAIQKIAEDSSWERVIILADGELQGLACAGAEVIRSLAGVPAWHSHMLDSRHVFSPSFFDDKALVIAVLSPEEDEHQTNCLNELHATGARIITLSARDELPTPGVSMNIALPAVRSVANWGYNFLFTTQALAYFRSGI